MALFNRNKSKKTVLPELEWYYDGERRDKSRTAWLLVAATIVGAVLLILGLFFGGRYIYRQINKDDKPGTTQTGNGRPAEEAPEGPKDTPSSNGNESSGETPAPATGPAPSADPTPTPTDSQQLANTGPASITLVFIVTVLVGTAMYSYKLRRSNVVR